MDKPQNYFAHGPRTLNDLRGWSMQTIGMLRKDEIQIAISRIQWWFRGGIAFCVLIDC